MQDWRRRRDLLWTQPAVVCGGRAGEKRDQVVTCVMDELEGGGGGGPEERGIHRLGEAAPARRLVTARCRRDIVSARVSIHPDPSVRAHRSPVVASLLLPPSITRVASNLDPVSASGSSPTFALARARIPLHMPAGEPHPRHVLHPAHQVGQDEDPAENGAH